MGSGSGSMGSYSPVPRYEAPSPQPMRTSSPAPTSVRTPAFKGSGMKLGSKKAKTAELLDALGGEAAVAEDLSAPSTPVPIAPTERAAETSARGNVPSVTPEGCV